MRAWRTSLTMTAIVSAVLLTAGITTAAGVARPGQPGRPGRPTALTPPRVSPTRDLGDIDAWSLSSGLYLQSGGPCGMLQIFRQARNGSITLVTVPHTEGDNHVLTALGSRLLIQAPTGCTGSGSLLWFDPGTRAEQWVVRAPSTVYGVAIAVPFYSRENGNL